MAIAIDRPGVQLGAASPTVTALRRLIFADPALHERLGDCTRPDSFSDMLRAIARRNGLEVDDESMREVQCPDPLGLSRWEQAPVVLDRWPVPGWLPARSVPTGGAPAFDWAWFGDRPPADPFFEDTARRASVLPLSRLMRTRTSLAALVEGMADGSGRNPDGLIFHMSRCGSTLLSRMLMADPRHTVLSEAEPIDAVVQWAETGSPSLADAIAALRAIVGALGRHGENTTDSRYFLKLDCWHILSVPLFRAAFPDTPWVFLHREPLEVMVSQMAMPGLHAVPGLLPAARFGIEGTCATPEEYCARVLAAICEAAMLHVGDGNGMVVDYDELPGAAVDRIPAHFGFMPGAAARRSMLSVTAEHAKYRGEAFIADRDAKRAGASGAIQEAVERHLRPIHDRFEELRGSRTT